jgi:hypothetical protein
MADPHVTTLLLAASNVKGETVGVGMHAWPQATLESGADH